MAPKAAPKLQANIKVVTQVVSRNAGWKSSVRLGRFNVPLDFFSCQAGDSGKNGLMIISGIAGMIPEIKV